MAEQYQAAQYGTQLFRNGTMLPFGVAFVSEDTVFRDYGPLSGKTTRLAYDVSPKIGSTLSRQTLDLDARWYQRLAGNGVAAFRLKGFRSWGDYPDFFYFGGNSEMRGYDYLSFIGNEGFFGNAELRFPLVEAMLTPIGVLGGIRGIFFANVGAAHFYQQEQATYGYKFATSQRETYKSLVNVDCSVQTLDGQCTPIYKDVNISGFRLRDGRASYGVGLESFILGFPIHFDFSWRTLFNKSWEDALFATDGGSSKFRKPQFNVWIGYDF